MKRIVYLTSACVAALTLTGCGGGSGGDLYDCKNPVYLNNVLYCTVTSPYTGRVWLDRNLGAAEHCSSPDQTNCYGDYYQWGRLADGHQNMSSSTSITLAASITPASSSFIVPPAPPYDWVIGGYDDDGSLRNVQWNKADGSSVCPAGYRVPTLQEFKNELFSAENNISTSGNPAAAAFSSFLMLPSSGYRSHANLLLDRGSIGYYWTKDANGTLSEEIRFDASSAAMDDSYRANGQSVRCIKN